MLGSTILRPSARTTHPFVKQRTRRYRHLPTSASFSSSSSRSTLKSRHWKAVESQRERHTILTENKCAKVRSWDLLRGPSEAFTLIRAVEQKYGPVESFIFQRDFDHPNLYQTYVRINFRDVESLLRVPESTETIHLRAPKVQARRPGGIGLDEILPLISEDPEFLTADQVSEMSPEDRSIDFRINRSLTANSKMSPYKRSYSLKPSRTGWEMLAWGGFYNMKPIDSTRPITNEGLTNETLDHVHMRMALRYWAQYLNVRNPYEVYPDEPTKDEGQKLESESSLSEKEESIVDPLSRLNEWSASDVSRPDPARDPFKEILHMEDANLTGAKMEPVGVTNDATEVPQSVSAPSTVIDATSHSNEPQYKPEPSPTTPIIESASQSGSPTSKPEVEVQEPGPKQTNREVNEALEAQLLEAKRLGELAKSTMKPKEKRNAKTKSKNKAKKQKAMPKLDTKKVADKKDLEPRSGFGYLFGRIQNLFRRS